MNGVIHAQDLLRIRNSVIKGESKLRISCIQRSYLTNALSHMAQISPIMTNTNQFLLNEAVRCYQHLIAIILISISVPKSSKNTKLICGAQREKCSNTEFFWSVFSRTWSEYGYLLHKSQDSLSMRTSSGSFLQRMFYKQKGTWN